MYKVTSKKPVTVPINQEGATITLKAPEPSIMAAGRQAMREAMDDNADLSPTDAQLALSRGILEAAIIGWTGIGTGEDDEEAVALEFSAENTALLLEDPVIFDALDAEYVIPLSLRLIEKNVSAASLNGILKQATADKTIADSVAATKAKPRSKRKSSKKA